LLFASANDAFCDELVKRKINEIHILFNYFCSALQMIIVFVCELMVWGESREKTSSSKTLVEIKNSPPRSKKFAICNGNNNLHKLIKFYRLFLLLAFVIRLGSCLILFITITFKILVNVFLVCE
jgi:hypothetical protein